MDENGDFLSDFHGTIAHSSTHWPPAVTLATCFHRSCQWL